MGNKFRNLWGKEAGWAHSVLFTAELRAFSERLASTVSTKTVQQGASVTENGQIKMEDEEQILDIKDKRIKRGSSEEAYQVLELESKTTRKTKRRKRLP